MSTQDESSNNQQPVKKETTGKTPDKHHSPPKHDKPKQPPTTKPTPPTLTPGFHGIIAFSSDNSSALASSPYIVGTHLNYAASDINPAQGQYRFDLIDKDMAPWVAAGKKVILRVSWSGWKGWTSPHNASWTPKWVYDQGVPSITDSDGSTKPQYWNTHFLAAMNDFAVAFAAYFGTNPHVLAIEIPIGDGGETKVDTRANSTTSTPAILKEWQAIGYTDQVWWSTIQRIVSIYQAAFTKKPLILMPDSTFIGGTSGMNESTVVQFAVAQKPPLWLQNNGLVAGQVQKPDWQKTTVLAEQRNKSAKATELEGDCSTALTNNAAYVLVFAQVLQDTGNSAVIQKYAALAK